MNESRRVIFKLWVKKSAHLLWGSLLYNFFAILIIRPLLATFFPELTPWEHFKGFICGHARTTWQDLLPYVGPGLWIAGNAFLFAWMNHNLNNVRHEANEPAGSTEKK